MNWTYPYCKERHADKWLLHGNQFADAIPAMVSTFARLYVAARFLQNMVVGMSGYSGACFKSLIVNRKS